MCVCLCGCASVSSYKDTHGASNEMNVAYLFICLFVYLYTTFREQYKYFLIKIAVVLLYPVGQRSLTDRA